MMENFRERGAIVTGAAWGIGRGIAGSLVKRGVAVVIIDVEATTLEAASAKLSSDGAHVMPLLVDVSDRKAMYSAADQIRSVFGRLDIVVNNAGVVYNSKPLHEIPDEAIDWCINVNIYGVLNGIKAFVQLEFGRE